MGAAAGGRLAAAVSAADGLGMLGGGYARVDWLERELELARGARIGVGFITFALDERPEALEVALAARPVAVQLSFGDPRPHAPAIADAGIPLVCGVQTDEEVDRALEAGAAVLVAQGSDGGGHGRPDRATMGLVPALVDRAGEALVVAAGGIADGRGLAGALALGAVGVSVGTRFLATAEAISTPAEAAGLVAARAGDTVRTTVVDVVRGPAWPDGYDGRAVRNAFIDRWHDDPVGVAEHREELHEQYRAAAPDDHSIRALWAGEGLDLIVDVPPAARVVDDLVDGAVRALRTAAGWLEA